MGAIKFLLPPGLSGDDLFELSRASVAGGQEIMPYPTDVVVEGGHLTVVRKVDESGCLLTPWQVDGSGRIMARSATLMERIEPYHLLTELSRGKLNQVRGQAADWLMGGLEMTGELNQQIRSATQSFVRAMMDA